MQTKLTMEPSKPAMPWLTRPGDSRDRRAKLREELHQAERKRLEAWLVSSENDEEPPPPLPQT